ncbi:diacylglycerol kinase [Schaalia sp. 19OD2882]|nr:diacylglycerol kinase [Schaalia sp. 19OD2882]
MALLVSSTSAHGRALRVGPEVVRTLKASGWQVDVRVTSTDEDPSDVAAASSSPVVAALGGDGYVAAVASALHRTGALFAPLPGGRGNDLCRALGIGTDPVAHARRLASPEIVERPLDAIRVTPDDRPERLAFGIVSFGLDATANRVANETEWINSGPLAYAWGASLGIARHRPCPMSALVDGQQEEVGGWLLSVSNSGWFGGGINLAEESDPGDGLLELVHVGPLPLRRALPLLAKVLLTRGHDPALTVRRVREVRVTTPDGFIAMADGDRIGTVPLTMSVVAGAVRVLAPSDPG